MKCKRIPKVYKKVYIPKLLPVHNMTTRFLEYLIPRLEDRKESIYHFFETRIKRICNEENFIYSQTPYNTRVGPGIIVEAFSNTANRRFGIKYTIGYSVISEKPQILKKEYTLNDKTVLNPPERFMPRLNTLDARIKRLFPDEPIILNASA